MFRMRTMIALSAGYVAGYLAGSGSAGTMLAQARSAAGRALGATSPAAHMGSEEQPARAGSRAEGDRAVDRANASDPRGVDHGVTVAPTPPEVRAQGA